LAGDGTWPATGRPGGQAHAAARSHACTRSCRTRRSAETRSERGDFCDFVVLLASSWRALDTRADGRAQRRYAALSWHLELRSHRYRCRIAHQKRIPSSTRWAVGPHFAERVRPCSAARTARAMATSVQVPPALLDAAAAFGPHPAGGGDLLPQLPASIALQIYNLLTVEERLRAREVSRAWRHVPGGWRSVDLQMETWRPQRCVRVLELVTKYVAANSIEALRVEFPDTIWQEDVDNFKNALKAVVNAHCATVRTLEVSSDEMNLSLLDTVLKACHALESCRLGKLWCWLGTLARVQRLVAVLKGDGRYSLVVVRALEVNKFHFVAGFEHEAQLCTAVQSHRSLRKLDLRTFIYSGAAGALARAAARAGVVDFKFACDDVDDEDTFITRDVAQLLNDFAVQRLCIGFSHGAEDYVALYQGPFLAALRNNRSLQTLEFQSADWSDGNPNILHALVGHPTLTHLRVYSPRWEDSQYFCESLAEVLVQHPST
jgi:hypothetical protein